MTGYAVRAIREEQCRGTDVAQSEYPVGQCYTMSRLYKQQVYFFFGSWFLFCAGRSHHKTRNDRGDTQP